MIEVSALRKRYAGADAPALDGVDLAVPAGSVFGLLGPNGAGKTTLIAILTGMLRADGGSARVGGVDVATHAPGVRRQVGLVPQELAFYPALTVEENLELFAALAHGGTPARVARALELAQLAPHRRKRASALSGGLKRRLNFAIGLLGDARVLCLDEPTAGVDPQSRHFLVDTVKQLGADGHTVLYTSHYLDEIERACDRVAILDHGRVLVQGEVAGLVAREGSLEALFLRLTHTVLRE